MLFLHPVELTPSGRPMLQASEVEHYTLDKVDLEFGEGPGSHGGVPGQQGERYKGGYVILTSLRIIWMSGSGASVVLNGQPAPGKPPCCSLPLSSIQGVDKRNKMSITGTKVRLCLGVSASYEGKPVPLSGQFHQIRELMVRCRGDSPDNLALKIKEAQAHHQQQARMAPPPSPAPPPAPPPGPPLDRKPLFDSLMLDDLLGMGFPRNRAIRSLIATESSSVAAAMDHMLAFGDQPGMDDPLHLDQLQNLRPDNPTSSHSSQDHKPMPPPRNNFVGVAGIVRREELKTSEAKNTLSLAFRDLEALMAMAKEMTLLSERLFRVQGGAGGDEEAEADIKRQLIEMGISNPITKESAGSRYMVELARQLCDFLTSPLQQAGGIMALSDVYCLYNRARGTELVSPDDLLNAIKLFPTLGLPLKLRNLPSGMPVIQSAEHSEEAVCTKIGALVNKTQSNQGLGPAISAIDVSRALSCSLPLAREFLLTAEQKGVLCRDMGGSEGLQFFRNFFFA